VLRLAQPDAEDGLRSAIAACAACKPQLVASLYIQLERGMGGLPLHLEVLPYRGCIAKKVAAAASYPAPVAMLVIRDPELKRDAHVAALREHYGLTPAEATLAVEMLRGDGRHPAGGVDQAFTRLRVSLSRNS
jgi:hypothetical protein